MSIKTTLTSACLALNLLMFQNGYSQNEEYKKYQGLLWEITGNGLKTPSYLFGTMHVSNKMVFHLADSFYYALKNVQTVAIELNPEKWQVEMVRLDKLQKDYKTFVQTAAEDYLNEKSFRIEDYEDELKKALQAEPLVVNGLLYRSNVSREDFEEDTFLDLYIYQTAKKLGKKTTGVEDFLTTEKLVLEAYADMANEKKPNTTSTEVPLDLDKKIEDAYRHGDLDLLDSLEIISIKSEAFRNKFLIARNEIQANSMDTILKKNSLFAAVGAAHLPGKKGIIEILRSKGYHLRPVKLVYTNSFHQNEIDKKKVAVHFYTQYTADSVISLSAPGNLYQLTSDYSNLQRQQFADMSNGSYYLLSRVQTYNTFFNKSEKEVSEKLDSIVYENIPGKIIKKTAIENRGIKGFDITSKTRRGDLQRYQIFITPFEIIILKISGRENYISGAEADTFFNSLKIKLPDFRSISFLPSQGGFKINLPHIPHTYFNTANSDEINRLEYSAIDKKNGNSFIILKKTINNFNFLDPDTFALRLVYESYKSSEFIKDNGPVTFENFKGYPSWNASFKLKDGSNNKIKIVIKGPQYYLLSEKSDDTLKSSTTFFSSFDFAPFRYSAAHLIADTFLNFKVMSSIVPDLDESFREIIENITLQTLKANGNTMYWPQTKNAFYQSDSTGEEISVSMQDFPTYFRLRKGLDYVQAEIKDYKSDNDLVLSTFDSTITEGIKTYAFTLTDTGSLKTVKRLLIFHNGRLYRLTSMGDSLNIPASFIKTFFTTFQPNNNSSAFNMKASKANQFFLDLKSPDSATHAKALTTFSNVYFGGDDLIEFKKFFENLKSTDKDYFDMKVKAIDQLGYISDERTDKPVVQLLQNIYESSKDTAIFQNEVIKSLAKNKTKYAYGVLKDLLLEDPPLFENNDDYSSFFDNLNDSLLLTRQLYPDLMKLAIIDDYKENIIATLTALIDSNLISGKDYKDFYSTIYFDAKIAYKKQQAIDEKMMKEENKTETDDDDQNSYSEPDEKLEQYATLLFPFYENELPVRKFFDNLLKSKNPHILSAISVLLLKNNHPVPDSILIAVASDDKYRASLYNQLKKNKLENKFPKAYCSQSLMARSTLVEWGSNIRIDSLVFIKHISTVYKNDTGLVYFFKYRLKKEDPWKMAFSGLQPSDTAKVSIGYDFTRFTDKTFDGLKSEEEQMDEEFKKIEIQSYKSGRYFYPQKTYSGDYNY